VAPFFLGCFAFGLVFTVVSFLLGAFGGGHGLHIPGLDGLLGHGGDLVGHGGDLVGQGGDLASHGADAGHGTANHHGAGISPFNFSTISAFLTWFGGAGYLLERYSSFTGVLIVTLAGAAGIVGGGAIFLTLTKYVVPRLTELKAEDYQLPGTVARVTSPIRAGGTGEIVYTLGGTRHADGARCVSGEALERGAEVVILKVERGIAYVERWDAYARQLDLPPGDAGPAKPEIGP
jgi:membrane protein implicated in regulation of membrane protease activity